MPIYQHFPTFSLSPAPYGKSCKILITMQFPASGKLYNLNFILRIVKENYFL